MYKETSAFHDFGKFVLQPKPKKSVVWGEEVKDGTYEYGIIVLYTLQKYGVLNKALLLKATNVKQKSRWKDKKLSSILKSLRTLDYISMYSMDSNNKNDAPLIIYILSDKGKELLKGLNEDKTPPEELSVLIENTQQVLERLRINQWHINSLYILGERVEGAYYFKFAPKFEFYTPSLIRYHLSTFKGKKGHLVSLFAYPAPNNENDLQEFMKKLALTYEFLIEQNDFRPGIVIILCENSKHAAWISWQLNKEHYMRPLNSFVYATDITTYREKMFKLLYSCDADETGMVKVNINLE